MDKTFGITDLVVVGDRVTTIITEAKDKTNLHARAIYPTSDAGVQPERYVAIVRAGPGHWRHFDISERDFEFLRWAGVEVEVIGGHAESEFSAQRKPRVSPARSTSVTLRAERLEERPGPSSPKVLAVA